MSSNPLASKLSLSAWALELRQYVGDPCAVILLRLGQPFGINVFVIVAYEIERTPRRSWRADLGVFVLDGFEMDTEHGPPV